MLLFIMFFVIGIGLGFILLTSERTKIFINILGISFFGLLVSLLFILSIGLNVGEGIDNYESYNLNIKGLEKIITSIQKDIKICRNSKEDKLNLPNILCYKKNIYIKEKSFNEVVIYLKGYFRSYVQIHNLNNYIKFVRYIKEKDNKLEQNFLFNKKLKNEENEDKKKNK